MPRFSSAFVMRIFVVFTALMLMTGCRAGQPWVEVGDQRYYVEIADDPGERAQGLMFRDALDDDAGMLFIFPDVAPRAFWMRNTRIPLDIVYLGPELRIVGWSLNTPPCRTQRCPSYPSIRPARYVLEVNAGEMARLGASVGDRLRVGNIPDIGDAP